MKQGDIYCSEVTGTTFEIMVVDNIKNEVTIKNLSDTLFPDVVSLTTYDIRFLNKHFNYLNYKLKLTANLEPLVSWCNHEFTTYISFTGLHDFEFCTKCDIKK